MKELLPVLEATAQTGKPLMIIAEGYRWRSAGYISGQ